jgi:hypothetical protein
MVYKVNKRSYRKLSPLKDEMHTPVLIYSRTEAYSITPYKDRVTILYQVW